MAWPTASHCTAVPRSPSLIYPHLSQKPSYTSSCSQPSLGRKTLSSQRPPAHSLWCRRSGFSQPPLPTRPRGSWAPAFLPPQPRRTLPSVLSLCFPSVLCSGRGPSLALLAVSFTFYVSDALTSGTVLTLEALPLPGPPLPSLE